MKRRNIVIYSIAFMIICMLCTPAYAGRILLNVTAYEQIGDNVCWAASSKSIIKYCTSHNPSQQSIVSTLYGTYKDKGATTSQIQDVLEAWDVSCTKKYYSLTYTRVKSEIDDDCPIMAILQRSVQLHANVIRGYKTTSDYVYFIEPYDGDYHGQSYSNYCDGTHWDGKHWEWAHSIYNCE